MTDELSYIGSWKGLRPQAGAGTDTTEKVSMTSRTGKVMACEDRHTDIRPSEMGSNPNSLIVALSTEPLRSEFSISESGISNCLACLSPVFTK
jgi:hypothetical protein